MGWGLVGDLYDMAPGMDAITAATDAYVPAGVKKMVADNKQF